MADVFVSPSGLHARAGHWTFRTSDTLSGAFDAITLRGREFGELMALTVEPLIIRGISLYFTRAGTYGGIPFSPVVYSLGSSGPYVLHYLGSYITTEIIDRTLISDLDIPVLLKEDDFFFRLVVTTANLDVVRISMWGTYGGRAHGR